MLPCQHSKGSCKGHDDHEGRSLLKEKYQKKPVTKRTRSKADGNKGGCGRAARRNKHGQTQWGFGLSGINALNDGERPARP